MQRLVRRQTEINRETGKARADLFGYSRNERYKYDTSRRHFGGREDLFSHMAPAHAVDIFLNKERNAVGELSAQPGGRYGRSKKAKARRF